MKKLFVFLLAVLMAGCSSAPQSDYSPSTDKNLTTVCHYLSGEIKGGNNGWYEIMRQSNETADLLFTDVETATRKPLGDYTTLNTPYGSLDAVFTTDGFVYNYFYGFPQTMNKDENNSALYQYDTEGNVIQMVFFDKNIKFSIGSAVVSDGENLYFSGHSENKSVIYALNQSNLQLENVYESDSPFSLTGGYKNNLVLYVTDDKTKTMEALDLTTCERTVLFERKYPWHMLDDGRLYNYYDETGVLKVYDLDTNKAVNIQLFSKADCVNSWKVSYPAVGGKYLFVYTSQYEGNYEKCYVYDLHTEKLTEVQRFCGKVIPAVINGEVWCMAPVSEERIYLNNGLTERIDYKYSIFTLADYLAAGSDKAAVVNEINYR